MVRAHRRNYGLNASYKGQRTDCDSKLDKAAGKKHHSSGYGFANQERDMQWSFKDKESAKRAQKRVQKAGKSCHVKTLVYKEDDE